MSESCVVDISFRNRTSKIKFDNESDEYSLTVDLGEYIGSHYEDSVFLITFESGEVRFSINPEDMFNLIRNIHEILKNSKEN
ncbi:MAG: hypothetical protein ACXAC2_22060 [Candidatus Kariarchaeaceae archaeon]|jgi:hypothetical protein